MDEPTVLRDTVANFEGHTGWTAGCMPKDLLILDIETLGFTPVDCKIVQLGMCVLFKT